MFVSLYPSNVQPIKNHHRFTLMAQVTYILMFNAEVLWPSHNIATLWHVLYNRCKAETREAPEPYATVRRRIMADGLYKHTPLPGWEYKIIRRDMLHKPGQRKLSFPKETQLKQSGEVGIPPQGID